MGWECSPSFRTVRICRREGRRGEGRSRVVLSKIIITNIYMMKRTMDVILWTLYCIISFYPGLPSNGGDSASVSSSLVNVQSIYSTESAFAALKGNGSVVTWGLASNGGDS